MFPAKLSRFFENNFFEKTLWSACGFLRIRYQLADFFERYQAVSQEEKFVFRSNFFVYKYFSLIPKDSEASHRVLHDSFGINEKYF